MLSHCFVALTFLVGWQPELSAQTASQAAAEQHVRLELVSEQDALIPSKDLWIGVRFLLDAGWHTYWLNPGDSGEPPRLEWHLPPGVKATDIQWPLPKRLLNLPFADYGYEHEVLLMAALDPSPSIPQGQTIEISALVRYLICREVCIPGRKQLSLTLPVRDRASSTSAAELFAATRRTLPQPAPYGLNARAREASDELVLSLRTKDEGSTAQFFPLNAEQIENAAPQRVRKNPGGLEMHLIKSKHLLKSLARLQGIVVLAPGRAYQIDVPVSQGLLKIAPGKSASHE